MGTSPSMVQESPVPSPDAVSRGGLVAVSVTGAAGGEDEGRGGGRGDGAELNTHVSPVIDVCDRAGHGRRPCRGPS